MSLRELAQYVKQMYMHESRSSVGYCTWIDWKRKTIIDNEVWPLCTNTQKLRITYFIECAFSQRMWLRLTFTHLYTTRLGCYGHHLQPLSFHPHSSLSYCSLSFGKIWDARNVKFFRNENLWTIAMANILAAFSLWTNRLKKPEQKEHARDAAWFSILTLSDFEI